MERSPPEEAARHRTRIGSDGRYVVNTRAERIRRSRSRAFVVAVAAAAAAALTAVTYFNAAVPAGASQTGVCGRTEEVRDALVAASPIAACADVTDSHLLDITSLDLSGDEITSLAVGDFSGLGALRSLDLSDNSLTSLPAGLFDELYSLNTLRLHDNDIASLPAAIFDQLFVLETLTLHGNEVTELPDGMFDDLSPFAGVHLDQDVSGLARLRAFMAQHSPTSVESFIAALPHLHKERVVLVYESGGLGAEHISTTHPRVVSVGANGEFVFAWLTNPDAPDNFKQSVEFLIPGATSWTAGVVDFSGDEPEISQPAVCQSCHGTMSKPLFPAFPWPGTEYAHRPDLRTARAAEMVSHIASDNPRISPLALDFPEHNPQRFARLLPGHGGAIGYEFVPEAVSRILAMRHAEVLLGNLKARSDYAQFVEDALCAARPKHEMQAPFTAAKDHTLGRFANSDALVGGPDAPFAASAHQYQFRSGTLQGALVLLVLHDMWETRAAVRDVYRATINTDATDIGGAVNLPSLTADMVLIYPTGQATAEDELLQLYRLNFGSGGRSLLAAVDSHNHSRFQDGSTTVDFEASHINAMAPRVCAVLRDLKSPANVRAERSEGKVTLRWDAPSDTTSVRGYRVLRSDDSATEGTTLGDTISTVLEYADTDADDDTTYYYRVKTLRSPDRDYASAQLEASSLPDASAPVIGSTVSFSVVEGSTAVATLSATDADTDAGDLVWSIPSGSAGGDDRAKFSLSTAGVLAFSTAKDFESPDDADSDGTYEVTVQVSDGTLSDTADIQVTLANLNEAPTAEAGDNQNDVNAGATVTLSGSGTDPDAGDTLSYAWTQTSGNTVTLTDHDKATATFTAPSGLTADTTLEFTLTVTDAGGLAHSDTVTVTVTAPTPLTAAVSDVQDSHDGTTPFTFRLRFSTELPRGFSYTTLRDDAFTVTGGTVTRARRLEPPGNIAWEITVTPSGTADVTVTLPVTANCADAGAICTADSRKLSNAVEFTVTRRQQQQSTPLTAATSDVPESHDGSTPITLRLRFSDTPVTGFSYTTMKDNAFTVTGGTITRARRAAPPGNVAWDITITPSGTGDITITLPVTTDCTDTGAICTDNGRKLSAAVELTIPGPNS